MKTNTTARQFPVHPYTAQTRDVARLRGLVAWRLAQLRLSSPEAQEEAASWSAWDAYWTEVRGD